MNTVPVIFSRRHHIGSVLLRTYMWSAWSHCGIVDGDEVIEAVFPRVRSQPLADFIAHASAYEIVHIPAHDPRAVIAAARSRIGKFYDVLGVLAMLLRIRLQRACADFCSELVAWSFKEGGTPLFRVDAWRIMPRDLYIRTYE
jgi:hypothetical protein